MNMPITGGPLVDMRELVYGHEDEYPVGLTAALDEAIARDTPNTPCNVEVESLPNGGVAVCVNVPSYEDTVEFKITVDRDEDGDWRVFVPWFKDLHGNPAADHTDLILENGVGVTNGICHVGADE